MAKKLLTAANELPPERRTYLSIEQGASYVGISAQGLRRLVKAGALSVVRPTPGRVVIRRAELDRFMQSRTIPGTTSPRKQK